MLLGKNGNLYAVQCDNCGAQLVWECEPGTEEGHYCDRECFHRHLIRKSCGGKEEDFQVDRFDNGAIFMVEKERN